ncbi:MAG: hypothetical protein M3350_07770 [Actinomycetota bacterium]|nr:hypothetical protein [Actinomycetota bacterium]
MGQSKKSFIALAVVVGVAAVALLIGCGGSSADEVRFQNVSESGPDPFTAPTDVPKTSSGSASSGTSSSASSSSSESSSTETPGSSGSSTPGSSGSSTPKSSDPSASSGSESQPGEEPKPGAFGGTGDNTVCDREKLVQELAADPAKLSAWADAAGVDDDPQAVGDYIRKLRPSTLTRDTQVTNHSYTDGSAKAYQAVLPKGTAVLVDEEGKPVVRCRCGNPLTEPVELEKQTKCINCPANYRPPPPCEGKCYRPEPKPPPIKTGPVVIDPIAASKAELEKCRKDKGSLEKCKTEYEKARKLCDANPLNPACDSTVCFDAIQGVEAGTSGCASYIDQTEILANCLKLETTPKQECLKRLRDLNAKCAADPLQKDCVVDPKLKAYRLRRQCIQSPSQPHCGVVQADCVKNPQQFQCAQLQVAIKDFRQKCQQNPALPGCKELPKAVDPALKKQAQPEGQEGDQGPGADGTGQDPGGGQAPGTGGEPPQPEKPAPQPENPAPPGGP